MDNPEVALEAQYDMSRVPSLLNDWNYFYTLDTLALRNGILDGTVEVPDIHASSEAETSRAVVDYKYRRLADIRAQLLKCYFPSCRTRLPQKIADIPELSGICALPEGESLLKYSFEGLLVEADPAILKQALDTGGTTMEELMRSQLEKELCAVIDGTFTLTMAERTLSHLSTHTFPNFENSHSIIPRGVYSKPELFEPTMVDMADVLAQQKTVAISGLPGSGKSELIYNFIKKYGSVFYQGILINSQQDFIAGIKKIFLLNNDISILRSFELLQPDGQTRVAHHLVERLGPALLLIVDDEMIEVPDLPEGRAPSVIKTVPQAEGEASADSDHTFKPPIIRSSEDFPADWTKEFDEATLTSFNHIIKLVHGHPGIVHSCYQFINLCHQYPPAIKTLETNLEDPISNRDKLLQLLSTNRLRRPVSPEEFDRVMLGNT